MVEPSKPNTEMFLTQRLSTTTEGFIVDKQAEKEREMLKISREEDDEEV